MQEIFMEQGTIGGSFRLRVKEVAQRRGWSLDHLASASGLPLEKVKELWDHPTRDQDLNTLVPVALALHATLNELVEIRGKVNGGIVQKRTGEQNREQSS
jgi:hypothetical protein